jgi:hypothetical protein
MKDTILDILWHPATMVAVVTVAAILLFGKESGLTLGAGVACWLFSKIDR